MLTQTKKPNKVIKRNTIWYKLHLWLGLISGIVVFNTCLTGSILTFEHELEPFVYPQRFAFAEGDSRVSLEQIRQQYQGQYNITGFRIFEDMEVPIQLFIREGKTSKVGYVDPYSGELLDIGIPKESIFKTIEMLHRNLLLGDIGKQIVGASTLIFLFLAISGLYLWWPKRNKFKGKFGIKTKANIRRVLYDVHANIGMYLVIGVIIFSATGLVWSYSFIRKGIKSIEKPEVKEERPISTVIEGKETLNWDTIYGNINQILGTPHRSTVRISSKAEGTISANITMPGDHENAYHSLYFDKYSGELLKKKMFSEVYLGDYIYRYIYPIHKGSIYGLPSQIFAFIVCIFSCSLPISGLYMYLLKKKK